MTPLWCHDACSTLLWTREKLPVWSGSAPLPVTKKEEKREGKKSISPWTKYGQANLGSFCSYTNGECSVINLSFLSLCICPSYQFAFLPLFHNYYLSSKGWCSFSPLPSPLFQSQVGHFLIRQVASLLSPKVNCMHRDVTTVSFCKWAK